MPRCAGSSLIKYWGFFFIKYNLVESRKQLMAVVHVGVVIELGPKLQPIIFQPCQDSF